MSAAVFALIAVVLGAFRKIILRLCMKSGGDEWPILIFYTIVGGALFYLLFPIDGVEQVSTWQWALLVLSGLIWVAQGYYELKSNVYIDASVGQIYTTVSFVLVVFSGVFLFGETISTIGVIGAVLIVAAVFHNFNFGKLDLNRGVLYKFVAITLLSINLVLVKYLTLSVDTTLVAFTGFLFPGIMYLFTRQRALLEIPKEIRRSNGLLLLVPLLSAVSYYCMLKAFELGGLSMTYTVLQTSVVWVYLFGILFLNEREMLVRRGVSSAVCLVGALLVCNF